VSHTKYIQAYYKVFRSLIAYVQQHYTAGLMWNNKDGVEVLAAMKDVQSGASTPKANGVSTGAPPPPPPPSMPSLGVPGAPPPPPLPASGGAAKGGDMSAVFNQLNQGSAVTSGLKKVDKSEMTNKNPSLRAGSTVPQRTSSQTSVSSGSTRAKSPMPNRKPESMRTKKPARKELDGNKWIIENIDNTGSEVHEIAAEPNHSILISRCTKCIIKVTGKANAISIDNCTGLSILVDSLISSLDVIKSPKFQVQINGVVPTVLLDQVDGATIYLGKQSLATEVFTSKCGSVNIVLPPKDEDHDDKECPLPEQIRSVVKDGQVVHEIVEHAG
jgi:adenylyl cyclase-associated protein